MCVCVHARVCKISKINTDVCYLEIYSLKPFYKVTSVARCEYFGQTVSYTHHLTKVI